MDEFSDMIDEAYGMVVDDSIVYYRRMADDAKNRAQFYYDAAAWHRITYEHELARKNLSDSERKWMRRHYMTKWFESIAKARSYAATYRAYASVLYDTQVLIK